MPEWKTFSTKLASYLISEGFKLEDTERTGDHSVRFVFLDSPELQKSVMDFNTCRDIGCVSRAFDIYSKLLITIKNDERY